MSEGVEKTPVQPARSYCISAGRQLPVYLCVYSNIQTTRSSIKVTQILYIQALQFSAFHFFSLLWVLCTFKVCESSGSTE